MQICNTYKLTHICFSVFSNSKKMAVITVSILSLIYIFWLICKTIGGVTLIYAMKRECGCPYLKKR